MSRVIEDQTPAEHVLRAWLSANRNQILDDIDALESRGMEVAYADLHSEGKGVTFLALPVQESRAVPPSAHALVWVSVHDGGHHVRYLALRQLVAVSLDEEPDGTRLSLHFAPPVSTITLFARNAAQRAEALDVAETLQDWLLHGWS